MADTGLRAASGCNERCGCPFPCPGSTACRCHAGVMGKEAASGVDHMTCPCGEHCGCNPCTCGGTVTNGTGRANCRCGAGCTCPTCAA